MRLGKPLCVKEELTGGPKFIYSVRLLRKKIKTNGTQTRKLNYVQKRIFCIKQSKKKIVAVRIQTNIFFKQKYVRQVILLHHATPFDGTIYYLIEKAKTIIILKNR